MTTIETHRVDMLPARYRILIQMLDTVLWWFRPDVRLTALATLLAAEVEKVSASDEMYDALIDTVAFQMKVTRDARAE